MQTFEMSLQWRLVQLGDNDQLKTPKQIVGYMVGAFSECAATESLWLVCFSVNRWLIGRSCLRTGPCVTAWPHLREVVRVAIVADARAIAIVRGEPGEDVTPKSSDQRLAQRLREAATALEIEWIDYLIVSSRNDAERPEYFSLWEHA